MSAAADRLYGLAIQYDPGIAVTIPSPGIGGADGIHDIGLQHLGQGVTPYARGGEGQGIHPYIIILPDGAGGISLAVEPFFCFGSRPAGPVRLAPYTAFPVPAVTDTYS